MKLITTKKPTRDFVKSPVKKSKRSRKMANGFFCFGTRLLNQSRVKEARKLFEISSYHDPSFAPAFALLGMTHIIEDRNRQGIKHCMKAVRLGYFNQDLWSFLAIAYGRLGKFQKMEVVVKEMEKFCPNFKKKEKSELYFSLFEHHWNKSQFNRATATMEILLTIDSNCCHWGMYSRCCHKLGRYDDSYAAADTALQLDPFSDEAFYLRGSAAVMLGRYDDAMLDLMTAQRSGDILDTSYNFKLAAKGYLFESRH